MTFLHVLCREVVHYDEFLSLSAERVAKLISSDRLTVSCEEQVSYPSCAVEDIHVVGQIESFFLPLCCELCEILCPAVLYQEALKTTVVIAPACEILDAYFLSE